MPRKLFLLGGSPAYAAYADEFTRSAGGIEATIAVLVQSAAGWEKFNELITAPWKVRGIKQIHPIMPDAEGNLSVDAVLAVLQAATAIFIAGGSTPVYHHLYATSPVREVIQQRYSAGIPVAGVSAGALISMEICPLVPNETGREKIEIVQGLALARGYVIGVHYTEWNALPEVEEVMQMTGTRLALGIDEPACAVFEDGVFVRTLGEKVHRIER